MDAQDAVEALEREGRSSAPLRRIARRYQRRWRQGHAAAIAARGDAHRLASAEYGVAVAERRAEKAEQRLTSLQALLQHGLALQPPDMAALFAGADARTPALSAVHSGQISEDDHEETLEDPRAFWAEEEEGLLQALDSDETLSALEEDSIYKRLAQIDTLRQRHDLERVAFEKRQAARLAAQAAQRAEDERRKLQVATLHQVEEQGRVFRAAALLSGARLPTASGDAGDRMWSQLEGSERHAAETLGWQQQAWDAGRPAETCSRVWAELTIEQQVCAALLGWNESKWEKLAGRKRPALSKAPPEAEPPLLLAPRGHRTERTDPSEAQRVKHCNAGPSADDLDPAATLAGQIRFVSLSAEPTGSDLVTLFDAHESQHLQALVTAEFTNLYASWLADPVRPFDTLAKMPW